MPKHPPTPEEAELHAAAAAAHTRAAHRHTLAAYAAEACRDSVLAQHEEPTEALTDAELEAAEAATAASAEAALASAACPTSSTTRASRKAERAALAAQESPCTDSRHLYEAQQASWAAAHAHAQAAACHAHAVRYEY